MTRMLDQLRSVTTDEPAAEVFVHPDGRCESDTVGAGTRIWAFAHVLDGASIGRDCNICDHAFVEGAAVVGDRVTVKNGVLIWDGVTIEDDVFIGPGVRVHERPPPRAHVKKTGGDSHRPRSRAAPRSAPTRPSSAASPSAATPSSRPDPS